MRLKALIIAAIFVAALAPRFLFLDSIDFAPLRQARSAIIARAMYYEKNPAIPEWKKEVSRAQLKMESHLEPRILENIAVMGYQWFGGEKLWIPRSVSIICWGIGGLFLFLIALRISGSIDYALLPTLAYLFLPFPAVASRGFQPDPMMIMFFLAGLYAQVRYFKDKSASWLIVAGVLSATAILVKPHCIFPLFGAFFAMSLWEKGFWKTLLSLPLYAFGLLSLTFGFGYYLMENMHNTSGDMALNTWVHADYWIKPAYWGGWLMQIRQVVSFPLFVTGIVGLVWFHRGLAKAALIGMWAAYLAFGLFFAHHISTHDYYHLFFVPIVVLSAAPVFYAAFELLKRKDMVLALIVVLGMASIGIQIGVVNFDRHGRWQKNEREIAAEIGERLGHSTKVAYLAISEGYPLRYYGEIAGAALNISNQVIEQNLAKKEIPDPDVFLEGQEYLVVTEILEYKRKPQLAEFVESHYPVLAQKPDYIIFDLRKNK